MRDISANTSVALWLKKACGSGTTTPKGYIDLIKGFFPYVEMQPDDLVAAWKEVKYEGTLRQREQFLDEWTEKIEAYIYGSQIFDDWTVGARMTVLTVIVSFFKHNRIPVFPEREKHVYVKYHNRDILRKEVIRICNHASKRDKAFFLMMTESGLRPETQILLRYKHIKKDFEAKRIPMMIDLPSDILKDRVEARWTFIGEDGFKALYDYLKPRLPLKNEDKIFLPRRKDYSTVGRGSFSKIFSTIALKLGIAERKEYGKPKEIRLYCLRKYFNNECRYEGFDPAYKEYWMAHETTRTHYVSRDPEKHREKYAKAYRNLRVYRKEHSVNDLRKLLEMKDTQLAELRENLNVLGPLLEFVKKKPKALQGFLDNLNEAEKQRLQTITEKWSKRAGVEG